MKSFFFLVPLGLLSLTTLLPSATTSTAVDCVARAREHYELQWQHACLQQKDGDASCVLAPSVADTLHSAYTAQTAACH